MAASCVGCAPTSNWAYAELRLNDWYMSSDISSNLPNRSRSTAAHEFVHGIGLAHATSQARLMYASISRYDVYGVYTPQATDIQWAWDAYH
jgi:hypothetical protein